MEADADFLRAWAKRQLTSTLPLSRALSVRVDELTALSDPTLPLEVFEDRPALSRPAYEQSIVEWREQEGRRMPVTDLERPARERLLHFLGRPGRAVLFEHALTFRPEPKARVRDEPPVRLLYREPDPDTEETFALLVGPIVDERHAQQILTATPTYQPWRHVGVLVDAVDESELPANGAIVDEGFFRAMARRAVGLVLSVGDNGHVFFWRSGCDDMAIPDRVRTEAHPTEYCWWWQEEKEP